MADRAAVILVRDGNLALMYRERGKRKYYTLPGGGVEPGETVEQACVREAREELGLDITLGRKVLTMLNGGRKEHYFLATAQHTQLILGQPETDRLTESNRYEPQWVRLVDIPDLFILPPRLKRYLLRMVPGAGGVPNSDPARQATPPHSES